MIKRAIGCLAALMALDPSAPANAVIMRHDVDNARYLALGEQHRDVLVELGLPAQSDGAPMLYSGMGTLIAPDWVVTAAHAAKYLLDNPPPNGAPRYVFIKGRGYAVERIVVHPQYNEEGYVNDIALIHLTHAITEAAPACLYEGSDEVGQVATLVGTGYQGNGRDGPVAHPDGALRGSTVRVGMANRTELTWKFHAPGERGVTPLEGISGPGDSGGPALLQTRAGFCIAGISSSQRVEVQLDARGQPLANQTGEGHYGVTEVYTRVSRYVSWIRETMHG
jgi:secreted trypsin-like serine protease